MKALDLFSCIGGHSIGLAAAGIETIAFCEKDAWRREIIAPTLSQESRSMTTLQPLQLCPPISTSAALLAKAQASAPPSTAPETGAHCGQAMLMARVVKALQRGLSSSNHQATRDGKIRCREAWRAIGYRVSWHNVEASSFGLLCRRRRRYAIACRDGERLALAGRSLASQIEQAERASAERNARSVSVPRDLASGSWGSRRGGRNYQRNIRTSPTH
jgi:site-specific DNA-cytosine methylase